MLTTNKDHDYKFTMRHMPLAFLKIAERSFLSDPQGTIRDLQWLHEQGHIDDSVLSVTMAVEHHSGRLIAVDEETLPKMLEQLKLVIAKVQKALEAK